MVLPPGAPSKELVDAVPSNAAFAIAMLDAPDAGFTAKLRSALDPAALRAAATERLALVSSRLGRLVEASTLELAAALATPDTLAALGLRARFVAYATGDGIVIVRVEIADAAVAQKTAEHVAGSAQLRQWGQKPRWVGFDDRSGVELAIEGRQLIVAWGPRDAVHAHGLELLGAAASPAPADRFATLAKDNHYVGPVGWLDPKAFAALATALADVPDVTAACRDAIGKELATWPAIAVGFRELSATGATLDLAVDPSADTVSALAAASKNASAFPDAIPGAPYVAVSFAGGSSTAAWQRTVSSLSAACADTPSAQGVLPPPWDTLRAAGFALYDVKMGGLVPSKADAFLALQAANPDAIRGALAPIAVQMLQFGLKTEVSVRKDTVLLSAGTGAAHTADFAPREHAPLFRVVADIDRLRALGQSGGKLDDDNYYRATGAGSEDVTVASALTQMTGRIEASVALDSSRVHATLAFGFGATALAKDADPRAPLRRRCVTLLHRMFVSTKPAIAKLKLESESAEVLSEYMTWGDQFVRDCAVKLTDTQRACLERSTSPLAAAEACTQSALFLPHLIGFSPPPSLEKRLYPAKDPAELRAKLQGTWVRGDGDGLETWTIDRDAITRKSSRETESGTLVILAGNRIALASNGGKSYEEIYPADATHFFTGTATPIASETDFVTSLSNGYLVVDAAGCTFISAEGLIVPVTCKVTPLDKPLGFTHATKKMEIAFVDKDAPYQAETVYFAPGWVLGEHIANADPFIKK